MKWKLRSVCLLFLTALALNASATDDVTLGNRFLELHFHRNGDQLSAVTMENHTTHRSLQLSKDDFRLGFEGIPALHAEDFSLKGVIQEKIPGGNRLQLDYSQRNGATEVSVIYELKDDDYFLHRHLEVCTASPRQLNEVDVWNVGVQGVCSSQEQGPPEYLLYNVWGVNDKKGFGLPVFLEDTFWGLEFPAGYNHFESGQLTLRHLPGRMVTGRFVSKTAVMGVGRSDQVAQQFQAYIRQLRNRPLVPSVQVDYNTWTTVSPATESNSLELIHQFRKNLFEPYGVYFDSFTLDDGWDEKNSLWAIRSRGFPNGFKPLLDALQPMGTRLGLWLSPSSGYEHARWGGDQGYSRNATFDWFLCQSDPKYRRDICKVVPDLIHSNDVSFFKMDGFCASCDTNAHPHHLSGDYAREASVDAFIEMLTAMRKAKPNVYLDPTSGMWLSPWWLWYVDSVYADTYDGTPPSTVPSPNGFDGATTSRDALLRRRLLDNPGFDPGAVETLGVYLDPTLTTNPKDFYDNWQDDAMMVAGRGNRLLTCYMNPEQFPDPSRDWPFLAGLFQWTRHNGTTLASTRLILGDPHRREAYGYAHFKGRHGILALRNPFIEVQTVKVKLDESCGWTAKESGKGTYAVSVVYPYQETLARSVKFGATLEFVLQPYQSLFVQLEESDPAMMSLPGIRSHEISRNAHEATWEVWGSSGEEMKLPLKGLPQPTKINLDGMKIKPSREVTLTSPGEKDATTVSNASLSMRPHDDFPMSLHGECDASIAPGTKAWIYVLCLSTSTNKIDYECHALVNNKAQVITPIWSFSTDANIRLRTIRELPAQPWQFFRFPLPEGQNKVEMALHNLQQRFPTNKVNSGWWLWTEQPLKKSVLKMEFNKPLPTAPVSVLPFPSSMEWKRTVIPIQPLTTYSF